MIKKKKTDPLDLNTGNSKINNEMEYIDSNDYKWPIFK